MLRLEVPRERLTSGRRAAACVVRAALAFVACALLALVGPSAWAAPVVQFASKTVAPKPTVKKQAATSKQAAAKTAPGAAKATKATKATNTTKADGSQAAGADRAGTQADAATTAPDMGAKALSKVVVFGASASYGINLQGNLADALGVAIKAEHEAPLDVSSVLFFMQDEADRGTMVKRAAEHGPSALVGLDFLFWYGYGDMPEDQRLPLLEKGLAILDTFACPIVVSEFPDMSDSVGLMLQESQMPTKETLVALNERLRAWAADKPRVILVPLADALVAMRTGKEITVGEHTLPAGDEGRYLQPDKLHPTAEGLAVMACLVTAGLRSRIGGLKAEDLVDDPATVLAAFSEATKDRKPRGLF